MPYTAFDRTLPDGATQNGAAVVGAIKDNQQALRDAVVAGALVGWDMVPSGGSASEPAQILYSKGTERIRLALTWTGGKVTQAVYSYSSNSGGAYDSIGTRNISYDGSDNVTGATWA